MLRWIDPRTPTPLPSPVRLRWAQFGEPVLVALLEEPRELARHRHCGSSVLCPGPLCALCLSGAPQDNRWYAAAMLAPGTKENLGLRDFTRVAWELTKDQNDFWPRKHDRPVIVRAERMGWSKGRVRINRVRTWDWDPIPEPFPIDPVLERVFRVNADILGQKQRGER